MTAKSIYRTKPLVGSLRNLEYLLETTRKDLKDLLEDRSRLYRQHTQQKKQHPYPGRKRRQKTAADIKYREIDNPQKKLKKIQRLILSRILSQVELPSYMFGAVAGKTLVSHASAHLENQTSTVVKLDISGYYPSVSCARVYSVWNEVLGCPPGISRLLTELTTVNWHLPQGAPTSPAIANIFLASIYAPVCLAGESLDISITTWVDDLIFSGAAAREIMSSVRSVLANKGLKLENKKREILGPRDEKVITGGRLGRCGIRAPHRKMSELRAAIHRLKLGIVPLQHIAAYKQNLAARIAHISTLSAKDKKELLRQVRIAGVTLMPSGKEKQILPTRPQKSRGRSQNRLKTVEATQCTLCTRAS